jgi:hypothetical protein
MVAPKPAPHGALGGAKFGGHLGERLGVPEVASIRCLSAATYAATLLLFIGIIVICPARCRKALLPSPHRSVLELQVCTTWPLCAKVRVPFMRQVQTFPDGPILFDHCNQFGFEGVVSKRLSSRYVSGPSRNWVKTKCPDWKRVNAERGKLFEGSR